MTDDELVGVQAGQRERDTGSPLRSALPVAQGWSFNYERHYDTSLNWGTQTDTRPLYSTRLILRQIMVSWRRLHNVKVSRAHESSLCY